MFVLGEYSAYRIISSTDVPPVLAMLPLWRNTKYLTSGNPFQNKIQQLKISWPRSPTFI